MSNSDSKTSNIKVNSNQLIRHEHLEFSFKELVKLYLQSEQKINHKVYRRIVKKVQRKCIRQSDAVKRNISKSTNDETSDYEIQSGPKQMDCSEKNQTKPSNYDAEKVWLERERLAQIEWRAKQAKKEREALRNREREEKIANAQRREQRKKALAKKSQADKTRILELEKQLLDSNQEPCKYFVRTGVCKYGNMCNRLHTTRLLNEPMTTLIIPGMYTNMLLGYELLKLNDDCDEALEYEESDVYEHFKNFYDDVRSELMQYGNLLQLVVCSNYQTHLRGNVYVQYENEYQAKQAYSKINGRFYAGKQIFCYFTHVKNWKDAFCSGFQRNNCQKTKKCNYMHIFTNPYNEFRTFGKQSFSAAASSDYNTGTRSTKAIAVRKMTDYNWSSDEESNTIKSKISAVSVDWDRKENKNIKIIRSSK